MPATRAGLILLSSPELLRSPPLITGATELGTSSRVSGRAE